MGAYIESYISQQSWLGMLLMKQQAFLTQILADLPKVLLVPNIYLIVYYTHMLLSVRENLPEAREELNPSPLSQRCGDVTELDQGIQKCPRLTQDRQNDS